jgi:hypothetical protein
VILRQTEQQHPNKETYQALPLLLYLLGVPYHIYMYVYIYMKRPKS